MTECACKWNGVGTPNPELIDACDAHRAWRRSATAEARRKAIEECARIADEYEGEGLDGKFMREGGDGVRTKLDIAKSIRALLSEGKA